MTYVYLIINSKDGCPMDYALRNEKEAIGAAKILREEYNKNHVNQENWISTDVIISKEDQIPIWVEVI
jgi:hypothetical protein